MAKSAKVFVFISLIYGALMFLIISFFHAGDVIQEDQNLNPTSKFLSVSETQGKSQVSTQTDQTETESITSVADEVEKQPEVETPTESAETATSETTTVPEETAEEKESTPKESVEETESVPDETVESENNTVASDGTTENSTSASNETAEETESIPSETIENAEVTPSETVEETNSVPNETIENVKANETIESTEAASTETVEETKSVSKETVKEIEAASTETTEKTETVPSETVEETKSVPNKTVQNKKKGQGQGKGKGKNVPAAPKKTTKGKTPAQKKAVEETKAAPIENKKAVPTTPKKTTPVQKKQKKAVEETKAAPIESTKAVPTAQKKTAKNKTPAQKKQNKTVEETKTAPIESTKTVPEGTIEDSIIANNTTVENTTVASEGVIVATEANTRVTKAFNYTALPFKYNPFHLMGAYPDPTPYIPAADYDKPHFGLINNDNYCNQVDLYNLHNPENMFEVMNFYTDFPKRSLMKRRVMRKLGKVFNTKVTRKMGPRTQRTRSFQYDTNITTFHITGDSYYQYHKIGQHFACATQMFSHIPNHTLLLQKDHFPLAYKNYQLKYQDKPQCLENSVSYPKTFRLFDKDECEEFFEVLHTRKYRHSLEEDPVQYLLKIGHDAHKAEGVFLVDDYYTDILNKGWEHGYECGNIDAYLIVQRYITNPMLLDNNNKFHMRVYLLIASTNPLIVFYHDGYLRASIYPFQKGSNNRAAHLTNLLMGNKFADEVQSNLANATNGMTAKELEDYYLWSFEELADYLYESGKTTDPNWLNNYLRPALQRAFVHVVRMSSAHFWKQSNVYEMFGCDFMMDDQTNLWFIEANANPLLDIQKEMMTQMLKDLFEINYAYYRSRMKRILEALESVPQDPNEAGDGLRMKAMRWRRAFKEAAKNRLEPEFQLSVNNTWVKIMDKNLKGAEAYYGHISEECL